ncbi:MAG: prolipoprotein diacylglyceryl transferase [Clostridiales bacterium]|jgi:phosphatidylglycerol:prolipoprotein diacylglycerol transferase|nr:prolipoprotein diacylglyceryl transferase [Clostridiales bacterium]
MTIDGTPDIIFPHLGIVINELSRAAFTVFGVNIYWYGIMIGLGIASGYFFVARDAKKNGRDTDLLLDFLLIALVFAVVGARLYYVAFSWRTYQNDLPSIFNLRLGGLAIYGAVIGAIAAAVIFTRMKKINFWVFGDLCVSGLLLGQIIGRWGNFFNREAFGGYSDGLFAMQYLRSQVEKVNIPQQVLNHITVINGAEYIQVHPTFLYEMLWNIGVLIFISVYKKHKKFEGELVAIYFLGYGIGRFWVEGLRTDQLILFGTGLAASQVLSVILAVAAVIFIIFMRKKAGTHSEA